MNEQTNKLTRCCAKYWLKRNFRNAHILVHWQELKTFSKWCLTHSQTSPCFCVSFENNVGKREIACNKQFLLFLTVFSTLLENFLQFSSYLKLSSANSFSLEESKLWHLRKGLTPYKKKKRVKCDKIL